MNEDWNDPLWCANAVAEDPTNFQKCLFQDKELARFAVKEDTTNLQYTRPEFIDHKLCVDLVKDNPANIQHVPKQFQSRTVIVDALNDNPMLICYVADQTETYQLKAVNQDGMALKYCDNPSTRVIRAAIKQTPRAMEYVQYPFEKDFSNNWELDIKEYLHICLDAVKADGMMLKYFIRNVGAKEILLAAVQNNPKAIQLIPRFYLDDAPEVEQEALRTNPAFAIKYASNPSFKDVITACSIKPENLLLFGNKVIKQVEEALPEMKLTGMLKYRVALRKLGFYNPLDAFFFSWIIVAILLLLFSLL